MKNIRWAVILLTTSLWGQSSVSISGTVTDATGAGISAAAVTVRNVETGAIRKVVTDDTGRYVAASLVVGQITRSGIPEGDLRRSRIPAEVS